MARKAHKARPVLEGLEDRQLMAHSLLGPDGKPITAENYARLQVQYKNAQNGSRPSERKLSFPTPGGGRGLIVLYGLGTLRGTTIDPTTGAVNIVYNDTDANSKIVGFVRGGTGLGVLGGVRDADVPLSSLSGVGANQINVVNLHSFDLISGGVISLTGGVGDLFLHSAAANTIINVQSLPISSAQTNPSPSSPSLGVTFVSTPGGGQQLAGVGGLTIPGSVGSANVSTTSTSGFTTRVNPDGSVSLIPTTGGAIVKVPPPGVGLVIDEINGTPRDVTLGNPQFFGYDPTTGNLVRFDASTGAFLGTISATNVPAADPHGVPPIALGVQGEVGLARLGLTQVVVVGAGFTVEVFDATTGAYLGRFSTNNGTSSILLNPAGVAQPVTGVGEADRGTVVLSASGDLNPLNTTFNGVAQIVDLGVQPGDGRGHAPGPGQRPPVGAVHALARVPAWRHSVEPLSPGGHAAADHPGLSESAAAGDVHRRCHQRGGFRTAITSPARPTSTRPYRTRPRPACSPPARSTTRSRKAPAPASAPPRPRPWAAWICSWPSTRSTPPTTPTPSICSTPRASARPAASPWTTPTN